MTIVSSSNHMRRFILAFATLLACSLPAPAAPEPGAAGQTEQPARAALRQQPTQQPQAEQAQAEQPPAAPPPGITARMPADQATSAQPSAGTVTPAEAPGGPSAGTVIRLEAPGGSRSSTPAHSQEQTGASNSGGAATSSAGGISPPPLPQRPPVPTPPAVTLMSPRVMHKRAPLSWRARAFELVNRTDKAPGTRIVHEYSATSAETFSALVHASELLGFHIDGASAPARQLAVRSMSAPYDRVLMVFTAEERVPDKTVVTAGLYPESKTFKPELIQTILSKAESILNNKGVL